MNVALVGPGLVGKAVLKQLEHFNLIGVASSKLMVIGSNLEFTGAKDPLDLDIFINHCIKNTPCILIDCTNSKDIAGLYPSWISLGLHVVTPNKKGFSSSYELFQSIIYASRKFQRFVGFEATVGAGLPIVKTLFDLVNSKDEIYSIQGVFSGTLAYLFNSFVSGSFSEIVSQAKALGYTEPDPRDDLSGLDVARKLNVSEISVQSLVPQNLEAEDIDTFMAKYSCQDAYFEGLLDEAVQKSQVLRYVGCFQPNGQSYCKLTSFPTFHPFASLAGSDNMIIFTTKRFPTGLVIRGPGAGAEVTAFGVLSDLLRIRETYMGPL